MAKKKVEKKVRKVVEKDDEIVKDNDSEAEEEVSEEEEQVEEEEDDDDNDEVEEEEEDDDNDEVEEEEEEVGDDDDDDEIEGEENEDGEEDDGEEVVEDDDEGENEDDEVEQQEEEEQEDGLDVNNEDEEKLDRDEEQEEKGASNIGKKQKKQKKRGVIYISRPPPFMKPVKVRHLLSQYGEVTNLYLQPEDPAIRNSRKKRGGSPKQKYTEGWVEFADRKVAKAVALSLNGMKIGGNRRSFHYECMWSLKYLSGFQWSHLTERDRCERMTRTMKLRAEFSDAKRDTEAYLENATKSKAVKFAMEKRKEAGEKSAAPKAKRTFKQLESMEAFKSKKAKEEHKGGDWLDDVFT